MWIEIFKGGTQTDNTGHLHDGDTLIDAAVASFDETTHQPPLVLGHPRDDSPAYGWVAGVKADVVDGIKRLFADVNPVDALKEWVNGGLYRNRSASFYPDGRLRHVGFLGGKPPAVKGLAPLPAFSDPDAGAIEFMDGWQQGTIARIFRRLREYFIEEKGADVADRLLPDYDIEEIGRVPEEPAPVPAPSLYSQQTPTQGAAMKFSEFLSAINLFKKAGGTDEEIDLIAPAVTPAAATESAPGGSFTEADIEAARAEGAAGAKAEAAAAFAEAETTRIQGERAGKIKDFLDAGVAAGKIAPAWVAAGMAQFMEGLADDAGDAIAFAEGADAQTPDAWFRAFLDGLPTLVNFSEVATRATDVGGQDPAGQLDALVAAKLEKKPDLAYGAAFSEVQEEHPDLARQYADSIGG